MNESLTFLFARHETSLPCRCRQRGYCPRHGAWEPITDDPEVAEAIAEASRPHNGGTRLIRKHLDN